MNGGLDAHATLTEMELAETFADLTLVDALQVCLVMLAQERRGLSKPAACNALGVDPATYDRFRRDATEGGKVVADKLRAARAQ